MLRFLLLLPLAALCLAWHSPHDSLTAHAVSPGFAEDHTLFVAASRFKVLLRSTDGGLSFETVNAGLVTGNVSSIALSPSFPSDQTLWCLEDDRVYRSTDAGGLDHIAFPWPPMGSFASGRTIYAQYGVQDAAHPSGVSLSNAVLATVP